MNFEYMPELRARWGYPAVLLVMALVTLVIYLWFRRRGWLRRVTPAGAARSARCSARGWAGCSAAGDRGAGVAPGVSPHLLPDPALEWLRRRPRRARASGSRSWTPREGEPHAERIVDAERLSVAPDRGGGPTAGARARSGAERGRADGGRHARVPRRRRHRGRHCCSRTGSDAGAAGRGRDATSGGCSTACAAGPRWLQLAQANTQEASLESVGERGPPAGLPARADARCAGRRRRVRERANELPGRGADRRVGPRHRRVGPGRPAPARHHPARPTAISLGWPAARVDSLMLEGDPLGGVVADRRQRPSAVDRAPDAGGRAQRSAPSRSGRRRPRADRRGPGGDPGGPRERRAASGHRARGGPAHGADASSTRSPASLNRRGTGRWCSTGWTSRARRADLRRPGPVQARSTTRWATRRVTRR